MNSSVCQEEAMQSHEKVGGTGGSTVRQTSDSCSIEGSHDQVARATISIRQATLSLVSIRHNLMRQKPGSSRLFINSVGLAVGTCRFNGQVQVQEHNMLIITLTNKHNGNEAALQGVETLALHNGRQFKTHSVPIQSHRRTPTGADYWVGSTPAAHVTGPVQ